MRRVLMVRTHDEPAQAVEVRDVPDPTPRAGEALVRVVARPINPADALLLTGRHFFVPELPAPVGIEGSGIVESGVRLLPGTRVAIPYGGTWTERMTIAEEDLVPLPDEISFEQGAMLCVNPFTAVGLLEGLEAGDWVLLNAANAAVARLTIALAALRSIRVAAIVRRPEVIPELVALGAEVVVPDAMGVAEEIREATGGGVTRALDAVAGAMTSTMHRCTREGGAVWVYGLLSSDRAELPASDLVFRDVEVRGFSRLRVWRTMSESRRIDARDEILRLVARNPAFQTRVDSTFPLDDVAVALREHEVPRTGKILLVTI